MDMNVEIGPNKISGRIDIDRNKLILLPGTSMEAMLDMTGLIDRSKLILLPGISLESMLDMTDLTWKQICNCDLDEFVKYNLEYVVSMTHDDELRQNITRILNQAFGTYF